MTDSTVVEPDGRSLRRDTLIVTACVLGSRVTGFGRVLATAAVLGNGALGDTYQAANLLPNLLFELAAGGVLQAVLVPAFVAAARTGDRALTRSANAAAGLVLAALGAVSLLAMLASPAIAAALVSTEPEAVLRADKFDVLMPMLLVFFPQIVCYGLGMVASAALAARGRFVAASLAPALNNVVVIAACLLFRSLRDGAEATLDLTTLQFLVIAGGTTAGVLVFSLAPVLGLWRSGVRVRPTWAPGETSALALRGSFGWASLTVVGTFLPTLAALLLGNASTGGVAIFVFAFAFFALPHALVAVPVATTLSPQVARRWQASDRAGLSKDLSTSWSTMVPLLSLGAAGMIALGWPVARAFGFGQIASQGTEPIAHALIGFGPGLIGYGLSFVMVRLLLAVEDVRACAHRMILSGVLGVAGMTAVASALPLDDRPVALAVGYGISQWIAGLMLTVRFHKVTGVGGLGELARHCWAGLVAAAIAWAAMALIAAQFSSSRTAAGVAIAAGGSAGVVVFFGVLSVLRRGMPLPRRA